MRNVNFLNPKGMPLRLLSRSWKTLNNLLFGSVQVQPKIKVRFGFFAGIKIRVRFRYVFLCLLC